MPKLLFAAGCARCREERQLPKLAGADMLRGIGSCGRGWWRPAGTGCRSRRSRDRLGCRPETVRRRLHRFNAEGIDGLGDRPGPGRRPRLTEAERSRIIALVKTTPPGRPVTGPWLEGLAASGEEDQAAVWTLDTLASAARAAGIDVRRSQVRRILLAEGVRWRRPRSWTTSKDPEFAAKERRSWTSTRTRRPAR